MTKSELIEGLIQQNHTLPVKLVEDSVKTILEMMSQSLENGGRIEIRGFGSFSLHYRQSRLGRNPKTGEKVSLTAKYVPHFKAGKALKEIVDR